MIEPILDLPWRYIPEKIGENAVLIEPDYIVDKNGLFVVECGTKKGCVLSGDAEYIVHAANMFPKLMKALRMAREDAFGEDRKEIDQAIREAEGRHSDEENPS
jgi:hypothetical protein